MWDATNVERPLSRTPTKWACPAAKSRLITGLGKVERRMRCPATPVRIRSASAGAGCVAASSAGPTSLRRLPRIRSVTQN